MTTTVWTAPSALGNPGPVRAWSLRPDLWGPGWEVWCYPPRTNPWGLADWGSYQGTGRPPHRTSQPGAVESLMAAGVPIHTLPEGLDYDWTEVTP